MDNRLLDRLFEKLIKNRDTGCWEWQGYKRDGYGFFRCGKDSYITHRLSYEIFNGEIPSKLFVLHKCDNRSCCNPEHLFLGTNRDNCRDRAKKGRGYSKLSKDQRDDIRRLYSIGTNKTELSRRFDVQPSIINKVLNREHVQDQIS